MSAQIVTEKRQVVFVLGMGRSGTSAVARVLSLAGGTLPELLVPAHESNPAGHWEPMEAMHVNDEFLFHYGSSWFDPTMHVQNENVVSPPEAERFVERIRSLFRAWPKSKILIIKEPRISTMAHYWFKAAEAEGFEIKIVIPIRNPSEVAASLATRNQLSPELSAILWLKSNLLSEIASRQYPRVFLEYTALLSDWRRELLRIASTLSIDLSPQSEEIDAFLRPELYREKSNGDPLRVGDLPIDQVYRALCGAATGHPPDKSAFDRWLAKFVEDDRIFRTTREEFATKFSPERLTGRKTTVEELEDARLRLEQTSAALEHAQSNAELAGQQRDVALNSLEQKRIRLEQVGGELSEARDAAQAAAHAVFASRSKADQALQALSEIKRKVVDLEAQARDAKSARDQVLRDVTGLQRELTTTTSENDRLHAVINAIHGSHSWKLMLPLRRMVGMFRGRS